MNTAAEPPLTIDLDAIDLPVRIRAELGERNYPAPDTAPGTTAKPFPAQLGVRALTLARAAAALDEAPPARAPKSEKKQEA